MGKTAFIFPGQGAQYVGMAKDFYDTYPECKAIIDEACELMDFDLKHILCHTHILGSLSRENKSCFTHILPLSILRRLNLYQPL